MQNKKAVNSNMSIKCNQIMWEKYRTAEIKSSLTVNKWTIRERHGEAWRRRNVWGPVSQVWLRLSQQQSWTDGFSPLASGTFSNAHTVCWSDMTDLKVNLTSRVVFFFIPLFHFALIKHVQELLFKKNKAPEIVFEGKLNELYSLHAIVSPGSRRWVFLFVFSPVSTHMSWPRSY